MNLLLAAVLTLTQSPERADSGAFVVRLGTDTLSIERY